MCPYPAHDSNVNDDGDVNDTDADNGECEQVRTGGSFCGAYLPIHLNAVQRMQ